MPVDISFTVIIPHYNIPELLERCLSSIPRREDVQVIVVDDCSEAGCVDKIRNGISPNYPNVTFVYQEENGGGGRCRNEALKYAKGRWLVFADADDFFSDDFSQLLDKYKDDDSDIIYFRVGCVFSDDVTKESDLRDHNKARIDEFLSNGDDKTLRYLHSEPWGKFVKRELVCRYGIKFSETKVCNDYYFSAVSGFHAGTIKADNTTLYFLTVREGSVSSKTDTVEKIKTRIEVTAAVEKYFIATRPTNFSLIPIGTSSPILSPCFARKCSTAIRAVLPCGLAHAASKSPHGRVAPRFRPSHASSLSMK